MPVDNLIDEDHPVAGSEVEREAATWNHGMEYVRTHASQMPALAASKMWRLLSPFKRTSNQVVLWVFAVAWMILGPLFLYGMWLILRDRPAAFLVLLLPLLSTVATAMVFYGSVRFRDSCSALFVIPAAVAIAHLLGLGRSGSVEASTWEAAAEPMADGGSPQDEPSSTAPLSSGA